MKQPTLPEVISEFMTCYGGIVSGEQSDAVEYLAPPCLADALGGSGN